MDRRRFAVPASTKSSDSHPILTSFHGKCLYHGVQRKPPKKKTRHLFDPCYDIKKGLIPTVANQSLSRRQLKSVAEESDIGRLLLTDP